VTKGQLPTDNVLKYEVSDDTLDAVKAQLGIEIAQGVQNLEPGGKALRRGDVVRFEYFTTLLEKYSADVVVTGAMFNRLGPEGVVQAPIILKHFADGYPGGPGYLSEGDVMWDDKTPITQRISDLQQRFLESFGASLATSTNSPGFRSANPDFAEDMAAATTQIPAGQGWGLSQVLRFGDYEAGFLTSLGTELYGWEKDQFGPVWSLQLNGQVMSWRLGTDDPGHYYDPFVGLFEAMGRTPQASLDFFNPDAGGSDAKARAQYFITDRTWPADDFNALGEALDAAATAFRGPNVSVALQTQSAWVASATIHYLAERDDGINNRRIGDGGKDSLAHILATYIVDVDRVANGTSGGLGVFRTPAGDPWMVGLPVGADWNRGDLRAVMAEVLTDDGAVAQVAGSAAAWNAHRIGYAADHAECTRTEDGDRKLTEDAHLNSAVQHGAATTGFVLSVMGVGLEAEAKGADERAKMFLDISSDVIGLVPTGGTVTSFVVDQALSAGKDNLSNRWTGNESRVAQEQLQVREVGFTDLQIAMAVALAERDELPEKSQIKESVAGQPGERYVWFPAGGGFDARVLTDPKVRRDFREWLDSSKPETTVQDLLQKSTESFDKGVKNAKGLG